jgi:hypothetical protein
MKGSEEICQGHAERAGQTVHRIQAHITFTAFDAAHVVSMQVSPRG